MKVQLVILMAICGLCASVLGQERGFGKPCKTDGSVSCDSLPNDPLRCIPTSEGSEDGVCGCLEGMFDNANQKKCVSPHGGKCTISPDEGSPSKTCTEFATCKKKETLESEEGLCECNSGYKANDNGQCVKSDDDDDNGGGGAGSLVASAVLTAVAMVWHGRLL